ncbi:hypothetical protein PTSG_10968 [Salpingoeca rosetta]|uniref:Ribosomal protein/NADH dehydrogenase domain-containing protein n=1 Tax=Salpingoeca rosetta (strain ATCC 50818 / BSB-021) TaxID=946362 RepID=F2USB6_SALR5|nr:uncharacterized protein PTSG_10968 [Salpingoeca rosetta]EGD81025.1 hypothetical protein PTSG_10968 [Salpingoeca rosetta]|eukprot:XP_004987895.1 hypothetical protein PTSG_10968 [Salpingoeca rosetta]
MAAVRRLPSAVLRVQEHVLLARGGLAGVKVQVGHRGPGHAGPRAFVREHFPSLKFHNEGIRATRDVLPEPNATSKLLIETDTGKTEELAIQGKTSDEILDMLMSKGLIEKGAPVDIKATSA